MRTDPSSDSLLTGSGYCHINSDPDPHRTKIKFHILLIFLVYVSSNLLPQNELHSSEFCNTILTVFCKAYSNSLLFQNYDESTFTSCTWRQSALQTPSSSRQESPGVGRGTRATHPHGKAPRSRRPRSQDQAVTMKQVVKLTLNSTPPPPPPHLSRVIFTC